MKKVFKNPIIMFILGALIFGGVGTIFAYSIISSNVGFTPKDSSWNVENTESALNYLYKEVNCDESIVGTVWQYNYSGGPVLFVVPCRGNYELEVWGAQGGSNTTQGSVGGKGGYSRGVYSAKKTEKLFIYVGGRGNSMNGSKGSFYGGWNGGGGIKDDIIIGNSKYNGTGGGATDISTVYSTVTANSSTLRYERTKASYDGRLIVAGGGGGSGNLYWVSSTIGGVGGGTTGGTSFGGTQTGISTARYDDAEIAHAGFGVGATVYTWKDHCCGTGGGGGWYGGLAARAWSTSEASVPSGGGSGYIGKVKSFNDGTNNITAQTIAGNASMPNYAGTGTMTGNEGNGHAKITLISLK